MHRAALPGAFTWMEAGPQSMKLARLRSRMRCRLLCTCVGSTSPCGVAACRRVKQYAFAHSCHESYGAARC